VTDGEKRSGFFFGRWYIGYLHEKSDQRGGQSKEIYVLTSARRYKILTSTDADKEDDDSIIKIWERTTCFFNLDYKQRKLNVSKFEPREKQKSVLRDIQGLFEVKGHVVCFLFGEPGTGKSTIGLLLAKSLGANFCKDWNPTDPADSLSQVYRSISPTEDNPLVLVLDEFDGIITAILNGVAPHKYFAIPVGTKTKWNQMLDDINLGMYPHLILLLTSNRDAGWINEQDPSLIREGRVDIISEMQHHSKDWAIDLY
jgi:hypothetical protein